MARKALLKRIKITKTGKILRRKSRVNHFNAKESRRVHARRKQTAAFEGTMEKNMMRYLQ